jgi:hypothetical protein
MRKMAAVSSLARRDGKGPSLDAARLEVGPRRNEYRCCRLNEHQEDYGHE